MIVMMIIMIFKWFTLLYKILIIGAHSKYNKEQSDQAHVSSAH